MIDVIDALDRLDECVRDQADGHDPSDASRLPGALLAAAVGKPLAIADALLQLPLVPDRRVGESAMERETLSIGALVALRTADRKQRAGACWSCSAAAAQRSVVAYVDLLPDRLLRQAAEQRQRQTGQDTDHHRCTIRRATHALCDGDGAQVGEPT